MAVFRIEKSKNYTVMSNYHLRDTELSLKAKGLLSLMLSLPEDWNYTTRGLAKICREGVDCIGSALKELEKQRYMKRSKQRDRNGKITDTEYIIFEKPYMNEPDTENPYMVKSDTENTAQLNTDKLNTKKNNTFISNTYPIQIQSDVMEEDEIREYEKLIKTNIEYNSLSIKLSADKDILDEILALITETVCTSKKYLTIAGDTFPKEVVKSRFLKINSMHVEYIIDCLKSNTTKIRNIKKYLLAAIFNAPSTIENYYSALVSHDMLQ